MSFHVKKQSLIERENQREKQAKKEARAARRKHKLGDNFTPECIAGVCDDPRWVSRKGYPPTTRRCLECESCLKQRRDEILGGALGEALTSSCVLSLTLTYRDLLGPADIPVKPYGAERLVVNDVRNMLRRLRKDGHRVRAAYRGEYGSKGGRAHWHVVLFFEGSEDVAQSYADSFTSGQPLLVDVGWKKSAPKLEVQQERKSAEWRKERFDDPDVLLVQPDRIVKPASQTWRYWPHGQVGAYLVKDGLSYDPVKVLTSVIYCIKYLYLCPWRDSKDWSHRAWDHLPEHIRQTAVYVKDETGEWTYGNPHKKEVFELRDDYMRETGCEDETRVPLDLQPYNVPKFKSAQGGLGARYLATLGRYRAGIGANMFSRKYSMQGANKPASDSELRRKMERGLRDITRTSDKNKWAFFMSDAQYKTFMDDFYGRREEIEGRKYDAREMCPSYLAICRDRIRVAIRNRGEFSHDLIERMGYPMIEELERVFADIPNDQLKGLVAPELVKAWQEESQFQGWIDKREEVARIEREGPDVLRWTNSLGHEITKTRKGRFRYREAKWPRDVYFQCTNQTNLKAIFEGRFRWHEAAKSGDPVKGMRLKRLREWSDANGWRESAV